MPDLVGFLGSLPAVIFASISTLESAGIQDSGSSTLSWIGILNLVNIAYASFNRYPTLGRRWHRVSYCCTYISIKSLCMRWHDTYLLMLSIRSIFLMPSQWRISGINAWKRISFTPAMFSVLLKYSEARSNPRFRAL